MSVRYEWASADHPFFSITVVGPCTQIGEFAVEAEVAIVIETDEVYILEGSKSELIRHFSRVIDILENSDLSGPENNEKEQSNE